MKYIVHFNVHKKLPPYLKDIPEGVPIELNMGEYRACQRVGHVICVEDDTVIEEPKAEPVKLVPIEQPQSVESLDTPSTLPESEDIEIEENTEEEQDQPEQSESSPQPKTNNNYNKSYNQRKKKKHYN